MDKVRYETDPYNRLVVSERGLGVNRQRRVIEGRFAVDGVNRLTYISKSPAGTGEGPGEFRFSGSWSLTKVHELRYKFDAENRSGGRGAITISGEIIGSKGDCLAFAVTTKTLDGVTKTYILELSGAWSLDDSNRIVFSVSREGRHSDELVFDGRWAMGKDSSIRYRYERAAHEIVFRGAWRLGGPALAIFDLSGSTNSSFRFCGSIARCESDRVIFEIGAGVRKRLRPAMKSIVINGRWKLSESAGLEFEGELSGGRLYSVSFGASARLTDRETLELSLRAHPGGRDLGIKLELKRRMIKGDGSLFVRMIAGSEESAVTAGGAIAW